MKKFTILLLTATFFLVLFTSCDTVSENGNTKTEKTVTAPKTVSEKNTTDIHETETFVIEDSLTTDPAIEHEISNRQIIDWSNSEVSKALTSYKAALTNQIPMIDSYENTNIFIEQMINSLINNWSLKDFAIIDLDNNDIPEVILRFLHLSSNEPFYEIIRYENDKLYVFSFYNRQFQDLKTDGTFCSSGGAADYGINTISFTEKEFFIDHFTYVESTPTTGLKKTVQYYINHELTTKTNFDDAYDFQSSKPNVNWYPFSEKKIEEIFSH